MRTTNQDYFKKLRANWNEVKAKLTEEKLTMVQAIMEQHNLEASPTSFFYVQDQMEQLKLDGLPYIDAKTFNKWKECGYKVKKGEKSKLSAITWVQAKTKADKEEDREKFIMPKQYHLFHKNQVEAI